MKYNTRILLITVCLFLTGIMAKESKFIIFLNKVRFGNQFKNGTNSTGNETNAIGRVAETPHVNAPPYKISSCEQVVEIEGQVLTDIRDFSQREDAFFTMSIYLINKFKSKVGSSLMESLSMDQIITAPSIVQGSVSCVNFASITRGFSICLKDEATANQILKAYNDLMKCRMGDNLKSATAGTINRILKASCLGLDVSFDIKNFGGDLNKAKAALQAAINKALKNASLNMKSSVTQNSLTQDPVALLDGKKDENQKITSDPIPSGSAVTAKRRLRFK
jgi:hypothetical protein